ncbi:valine--tRNA ligase [Candidatus Microgenomates bacterium]|nr:valine--tRNA ligase [Candidatus Microgenomates bacterium]
MEKTYDQTKVEKKWYKTWEKAGYFKPEINPNGNPYSIVLPPPNVTGTLHMGHALMLVIEDILIRHHRMLGDKTLWLPGTDHAAIATQSKVESLLFEQTGTTRHDLGREKFLEKVREFAQASHDTIVTQIRAMGASVDWTREAYTLDEPRNLAVRTAFKTMYEDGLIYRGETIVNWDPKLQTTVSDDEIEWKEENAPLYYLKYGPFTIATARPETKFGDKYVVMHPNDPRYKDYKDGQKIDVEWINGKITATVIKDEVIDTEFGTGVMTITPWHDKTDFEIAKRHNLDVEQIIDFDGTLLPIAGDYAGQHIRDARAQIVEKLKTKGLLEKVEENYTHRIATNYRGGGIIEPQIKKQWMIDVNKEFPMKDSHIEGVATGEKVTLKKLMKYVVKTNQVNIIPEKFIKTYYHWIDNLRDWCISRQIWYGHQIPVWYKGEEMYVGIEAPEGDSWEQDPDTLDTWFSSGLWTFSTLGWPEETEDLKTFHPTSVLETGYDILFFWVARMILMTTYLRGEIPFRDVFLHGLVRDTEKQKMSKTKGNVIDPLNLIEKYGTDALRMALVFGSAGGNDTPMSEDKVRGMRNFTNKLWNMGRFIVDFAPEDAKHLESELTSVTELDQPIIDKLTTIRQTISEALDNYRFHQAAETLYEFVWHEFADKYIESTKERRAEAQPILEYVFRSSLELLHPFMPFITEELWQKLPHEGESIMVASWPKN